jgi:hypothetical protein
MATVAAKIATASAIGGSVLLYKKYSLAAPADISKQTPENSAFLQPPY